MKNRFSLVLSFGLLVSVLVLVSGSQTGTVTDDDRPAFPGAEGFGAFAVGGRGGDVYHVTSLLDSGPGSLRNGIQTANRARTIVFDLSGTIFLQSKLIINKPYLTLAGQTAPGDGITVAGWTTSVSNTHDVVVRYMRFRPGDINCPRLQDDSLNVDNSVNVIIDHVSASWSIDETLSVTHSDRVTVQWSLITESLNNSCHLEGQHGYGSLLRYGNGGLTFHHNLYAHHFNRNPRLGDDLGLDFVNNVVYDWGTDAGYSGDASEGTPRLNYVGNYVIAGPATPTAKRARAFRGGSDKTLIYQSDNLIDSNVNGIRDGVNTGWGMFVSPYTQQSNRFEFPQIQTDSPGLAYRRVLANAGDALSRDPVDIRIISDVMKEGGRFIDSQHQVGDWPDLKTLPPPPDSDRDGVPDEWEIAHGMNPCDASDGPALTESGYSNLEVYLTGLLDPPRVNALVDDRFADGTSQKQDLANNSLKIFNGRASTVRTDAPGSVTFDVTNAGGSEAFWAFFTNVGSPVVLGVGDRLAVALSFSLSGFQANGSDIRFGVLDSLGTRNTANLTGGMNDPSFVNDPGYGLQFFASGAGSPFVIGRRANLTGGNIFNNFADFSAITAGACGAVARQPLTNNSYTLTYTISRLTAADTRISVAVAGGPLSGLNYTVLESISSPNTSFDYFAFRIAGPSFATKITFTQVLVVYAPTPPLITSQPQPQDLTVQVGNDVTLSVGASGSMLTYQWQKDAIAISANGNPSATTPTLNLRNVQLSNAGKYACVVSNPGGSVVSDPIQLKVSVGPVGPPPMITTQPADTTITVGNSTSLSVVATGSSRVYQWFKDGTLIPRATTATLNFPRVQVSDSGAYKVVVSNSSGSVTSMSARLLVLSAMAVRELAPANRALEVCIDSPLSITFEEPVHIGKTGRFRVHQTNGAVVDMIDVAVNSNSRMIGTSTTPFNYYPILVTGRTATIYLHKALDYDQTYYVTIELGVFIDADGAPYGGISDPEGWRFTTTPTGPPPGSTELTVAADGNADFCTVQGAIDFVPLNNKQRVVITVHRGTYTEIVYVGPNKPFITVRGEHRSRCVIQYANNAVLNSGNLRAMFGVDAPDFVLENITLINTTPKGGSQAEAFRGNNQRILLNRVTLKSFQDTLLLQGTGFVTDSYIEGDVDFMWGTGAVFFQRCELKAVYPGYYAQIRNPRGNNGNVYVNCRLTGAPDLTNVYLARVDPNVFPYSQTVFIYCAMGPHILPVGWLLNNATAAPSVQFWEYNSTDLSGAPLKVGERAPFSRQLTAAEAAQWSDPRFVLGGWLPAVASALINQ